MTFHTGRTRALLQDVCPQRPQEMRWCPGQARQVEGSSSSHLPGRVLVAQASALHYQSWGTPCHKADGAAKCSAGLLFFLFIIPVSQGLTQVSFLYSSCLGHSILRASLPVCCKFLLHSKPVPYASLQLMELLDLHLFCNCVLGFSPGQPSWIVNVLSVRPGD